MEKFLIRKGRLQLNSCNDHLLDGDIHTTAEICLWHDNEYKTTRHTIASYRLSKDGYFDLKFCANRPFDKEVDPLDFMYLAKLGYELLMNN